MPVVVDGKNVFGEDRQQELAEQDQREPAAEPDQRRRRGAADHHGQQQREREPERRVQDGRQEPREHPGELLRVGDDPEADDPERRHEDDEGAEHHGDHGDPRSELAVDDVVAMDRLGEQPRQGALAALAVDAVEAEGDADERDEHRGEGDRGHAADALRSDDEQREEHGAGSRPAAARSC